MTQLRDLHCAPLKDMMSFQMKTTEEWLQELVLSIPRKSVLGSQLEVMMDSFGSRKNDIEDGYDALLGSRYEDENEETIHDLLKRDPLTFIAFTLYLPSLTEKDTRGNLGVDLHGTFDLYSQKIKSQHKQYWRWDLLDDPKNLRWNENIIPPAPGFAWEAISVNELRNNSPEKVRKTFAKEKTSHQLPHVGVYATASMHPKWVKAMDGDTVPYVWAAGLDVCDSGGRWDQVPSLHFSQEVDGVGLGAVRQAYSIQFWALGLLRESVHYAL